MIQPKPYAQDFLHKLLHYAIKTNNFVFNISRDKTGLTPNCDHYHNTEDNIHLFTTCSRLKKIWAYFHRQYTPQQHIFTLSVTNFNSKNKKLVLTLTQIIMYKIWTSRINLKYNKTQLSQETIIKILTQLWNIRTTHYNTSYIY